MEALAGRPAGILGTDQAALSLEFIIGLTVA